MFTGKFDLNSHRGGSLKQNRHSPLCLWPAHWWGRSLQEGAAKHAVKPQGAGKNKTKQRREGDVHEQTCGARPGAAVILYRPGGGPPSRGLRMRSPVASSNGDPTKSMCAEARYLIQWRPGQRLPYAAPRRGLEPKAGHNQALTLKTMLGRILLYSFFGGKGSRGILLPPAHVKNEGPPLWK